MIETKLPAGFDAAAYFVTNMMQGKADQLQMVNTFCGHPARGMITFAVRR